MSEVCELLEWDSEFFGHRIARVVPGLLTRALLDAVEAQVERERLDCLYFLADPEHSESVALAQQAGFRMVDVRIELELHVAAAGQRRAAGAALRPATLADAEALRAIARAGHRVSRFYQDGHFARERCDALYETWIDKSLRGWADAVFVSELDGAPAGYITCTRRAPGAGQIGLLAVEPRAHGSGHGARLLCAAVEWFRDAGCDRAIVVTQGQNIAAQRLYQRGGFSICRTQLWFHRWPRRSAPGP